MPDSMRPALKAAVGTEASELLTARALCMATGHVFKNGHPEAALDVAAVLDDLGVSGLASDFRALADTHKAA